jgi:hypothetical protein
MLNVIILMERYMFIIYNPFQEHSLSGLLPLTDLLKEE